MLHTMKSIFIPLFGSKNIELIVDTVFYLLFTYFYEYLHAFSEHWLTVSASLCQVIQVVVYTPNVSGWSCEKIIHVVVIVHYLFSTGKMQLAYQKHIYCTNMQTHIDTIL